MIEIERKFLVTSNSYKLESSTMTYLVQGFLNSDPNRTVRIRVKGDKGFLTVKGKSSDDGISRFEWETIIPLEDAKKLLELCQPGLIEKNRYEVILGKHVFEVDEFLGENEGLVMAEIELASPDENFLKPTWLGQEVTGDNRYYNSQLSKNPFKKW